MYIAMNRFQIRKGHEDTFEKIWRERDSHLKDVPGFVEFQLLKGPEEDDHTLYASHTVWQSYDAFDGWTKSQSFRDAHKNAGDHGDVYLGHPKFEGFEVVLDQK